MGRQSVIVRLAEGAGLLGCSTLVVTVVGGGEMTAAPPRLSARLSGKRSSRSFSLKRRLRHGVPTADRDARLFIYLFLFILGERETTGVTGEGVRLGGGADSSQSGGKEGVRYNIPGQVRKTSASAPLILIPKQKHDWQIEIYLEILPILVDFRQRTKINSL